MWETHTRTSDGKQDAPGHQLCRHVGQPAFSGHIGGMFYLKCACSVCVCVCVCGCMCVCLCACVLVCMCVYLPITDSIFAFMPVF